MDARTGRQDPRAARRSRVVLVIATSSAARGQSQPILPIFGYWNEGHFRWRGTHVAWDGMVPVARSAKRITPRAWSAAFAYVAKKHGFIVDRHASVRIRGACVGAVLDPSLEEPNRGVVIEVRIDSPTGPFKYRFGMGKPTIEDAVGASLDWAIGFALTVNRADGTGMGSR
jgi:hypothetical protein